MANDVSPLAPERFPDLPAIEGVRLASAHCGIRYQGRTDLMVALLDPGTTVAGVFTRSLMPGAPVDWCRRALPHGQSRREGARLRPARDLRRLDRRHWREVAGGKDRRGAARRL
jgi:hypothetical protein